MLRFPLSSPLAHGARTVLARATLAAVALLGAGCAGGPPPVESAPEPIRYPEAPKPTNGSLFNAGSPVALFSDQRARRVGDVLTIMLQERTQASTSSSTDTSKNSEISLPNPVLFGGQNLTIGGKPVLENQVGTDRAFSGAGSSQQANQLDGFISAQVVEVTPNGLLRVRGEKRLQINRGDELIVITGLVRPQDITPDNRVASLRVANADISYRGRGALGQANQQGWLDRFFNSPLWPF